MRACQKYQTTLHCEGLRTVAGSGILEQDVHECLEGRQEKSSQRKTKSKHEFYLSYWDLQCNDLIRIGCLKAHMLVQRPQQFRKQRWSTRQSVDLRERCGQLPRCLRHWHTNASLWWMPQFAFRSRCASTCPELLTQGLLRILMILPRTFLRKTHLLCCKMLCASEIQAEEQQAPASLDRLQPSPLLPLPCSAWPRFNQVRLLPGDPIVSQFPEASHVSWKTINELGPGFLNNLSFLTSSFALFKNATIVPVVPLSEHASSMWTTICRGFTTYKNCGSV